MQYEVIRYFTDAQDNDYAYREGDIYPREGHSVSDLRIKDLMSGNNFQRIPLIKRVVKAKGRPKKTEVVQEVNNGEVGWTVEDINSMPFMKLKSIAKQNGVEVEERKASDIREDLIKKLGL